MDMDGLMHDLAVCLPKDTIITNDAGNFLDGYQDIIVLNKKHIRGANVGCNGIWIACCYSRQNWRSLTNMLFLFRGMVAS